MSETIRIGTHDQIVAATAIVTGKPVVGCPNIGDAAAPVTYHRGKYAKQIGQAADYRHDVSRAVLDGDALVTTRYDSDTDSWVHSTTADAERVAEVVRQMDARDRAMDAERQAEDEMIRQSIEADRQKTGDLIRATLAANGHPVETLRWTDNLVSLDRLAPETAAAVAAADKSRTWSGHACYDARTQAGVYRVWPADYAGKSVVVPLVPRSA